MDAQKLFREGVLALRERKDAARARDLLTQSLRANPDNEMAWLWLARTYTNKEIQLQCVERALRINPANEQALSFKERLLAEKPLTGSSQVSSSPFIMEPEEMVDHRRLTITGQPIHMFEEEPESPEPSAPMTIQTPLTPAEEKQIAALLAKAKELAGGDDVEGAIEQWVYVLDIRVDHPEAIQNATRALAKLKYLNDVETLLNNAIEAGTNQPSIYLTAIDMARHKGEIGEMEMLMEQVAKLPSTSEEVAERMVKHFTADQPLRAVELLREVIELHPDSTRLSLLMGDLLRETMMQPDEAEQYYQRAAQGSNDRKIRRTLERSRHGRVPVIGDRERGSLALALREAVGFSAVYLLMGWQDAGLNLLNMGVSRWLGVGLAFVGGYALITATSSPQQKPLAGLLGGKVPPKPPPKPERKRALYEEEVLPTGPVKEPTNLPILPPVIRIIFGIVGALILVGAFALVFSTALQLLRNPIPPDIPSLQELMSDLEGF